MAEDIARQKILIVEDEKMLQEALTEKLIKEGFDVISAGDGADGLRIAYESHPDLILLDITMPVMDGNMMLEKLRQDSWGSKVPVMILTNRDDSSNISAMINSKINKYFIKSDERLEDIIREIKEMLPVIQRVYPIQ